MRLVGSREGVCRLQPGGGGRRRMRRCARGFSILELLVVIAILLIISAIAMPNIMNAIADIKLRASANAVVGVIQDARMLAVHDNKYYTVRMGTLAGVQIAYIDKIGTGATDGSGNGSYDNTEQVAQLTGTTRFAQTGAPSFNSNTLLGVTGTTTGDAAIRISFNGRGLPCRMNGSVCSNLVGGTPVSYVYFLTDLRPINGWAAVSVSPAGRVKVWYYAGTAWQ